MEGTRNIVERLRFPSDRPQEEEEKRIEDNNRSEVPSGDNAGNRTDDFGDAHLIIIVSTSHLGTMLWISQQPFFEEQFSLALHFDVCQRVKFCQQKGLRGLELRKLANSKS